MKKHGKGKKGRAGERTGGVSVVLVEPRGSGNVGSVARAMKNTGFSDLVLVAPCEYTNDEALSMACKAHDLLLGARVFSTLDECLDEADVVVGTTRRQGRLRYPLLTLEEAAPKILELARSNRVSILFGREDRGLLNTEIPRCDILLEIPTREEYPSLNLAQAVMLVCHCLFMSGSQDGPAIEVAPRDELEMMYVHMERTLRALGYGEQGGEGLLETILRSFRRLLGRTGLMQKEINMLRGIFSQIEGRITPGKEAGDEKKPR